MSKLDKAKEKLKSVPRDFTYSEAKYLLTQLGFKEYTKGKTSGSRVKFYRENDGKVILLHKPHPGDEMKISVTRMLKEFLEEMGEI